jgi:hypothetical protein
MLTVLHLLQFTKPVRSQGLATIFFYPSTTLKKPQGRNLKWQIFIQHFFKIVLYCCLYLTCHNIGTHLKLNKYIFNISIPFCHHLYLFATLKQCFTEFAVYRTTFYHDDRSVPGRIPTCDLIGRLFLGSGLQRMCWSYWHVNMMEGNPVDCKFSETLL